MLKNRKNIEIQRLELMTKKDNKILHLTLKKKWFDMILSGEKKEEYRDVKQYWIDRLKLSKQYDVIKFKNGYSKNARQMVVEFKGCEIGSAVHEWSDGWQGQVFIIKLGNILETTNC